MTVKTKWQPPTRTCEQLGVCQSRQCPKCPQSLHETNLMYKKQGKVNMTPIDKPK